MPTMVMNDTNLAIVEMTPADGFAGLDAEFEEEFNDFSVEQIKAGGSACTSIGTCLEFSFVAPPDYETE